MSDGEGERAKADGWLRMRRFFRLASRPRIASLLSPSPPPSPRPLVLVVAALSCPPSIPPSLNSKETECCWLRLLAEILIDLHRPMEDGRSVGTSKARRDHPPPPQTELRKWIRFSHRSLARSRFSSFNCGRSQQQQVKDAARLAGSHLDRAFQNWE